MTDPAEKLPSVLTQEFTVTVDLVEPPAEEGKPYKLTGPAQTVRDLPTFEVMPWER